MTDLASLLVSIPIAIPVVFGLVYLAREAEVFDVQRGRITSRHPFIRRMLECAPCTSAWVAGPGYALVALPMMLPPWTILFVALTIWMPLGSIGLTWAVGVLSPVQAVSFYLEEKDAEGKAEKRPEA